MWRGTGNVRGIKNSAGHYGCSGLFAKAPGRALRGRWGSIESLERTIIKALAFIGSVFAATFARVMEADVAAAEVGAGRVEVGAEEADRYRADWKHFRKLAVRAT